VLSSSRSTAATGPTPTPCFGLDVKRDVSVAPGGVFSLTSDLPLSIYVLYVDYASGAPGLGLAKIFSSPPESPTDGVYITCRPIYVPAYLRSGLPTFRLTYMSAAAHPTWLLSSSISSSSGTPIFLFYVIGFFFVYKIIFLFFLLSMQLKHVIVILLT
jgi:hypothetical protein